MCVCVGGGGLRLSISIKAITEYKKKYHQTLHIYDLWRHSNTKHFTFNEALEFFHPESSPLQLNLQGHQDGKQELVFFKQTSGSVRKHLKCEVLYDVVDSLCCDW